MMRNNNSKIVYPDLSYKINGITFAAKKKAGRFANEKQYCDAIEELLQEQNIPYEREKVLSPSFEGEAERRHKVDFLINGKIILEIKAKPFLTKNDYYQTRRYLAALRLKLAILVNMRSYYITPKRVLNSDAEE